ncbi:hypothetical protein CRG98_006910 [Punica granatum]|uniref:Uncharacterized protein n=1 Tax=Punica granatum TaxID=22663 RepID=A0A2I0KW51_PUNGR|nr:hypothetical protein CRG98_006910 [Punica granatum]
MRIRSAWIVLLVAEDSKDNVVLVLGIRVFGVGWSWAVSSGGSWGRAGRVSQNNYHLWRWKISLLIEPKPRAAGVRDHQQAGDAVALLMSGDTTTIAKSYEIFVFEVAQEAELLSLSMRCVLVCLCGVKIWYEAFRRRWGEADERRVNASEKKYMLVDGVSEEELLSLLRELKIGESAISGSSLSNRAENEGEGETEASNKGKIEALNEKREPNTGKSFISFTLEK